MKKRNFLKRLFLLFIGFMISIKFKDEVNQFKIFLKKNNPVKNISMEYSGREDIEDLLESVRDFFRSKNKIPTREDVFKLAAAEVYKEMGFILEKHNKKVGSSYLKMADIMMNT